MVFGWIGVVDKSTFIFSCERPTKSDNILCDSTTKNLSFLFLHSSSVNAGVGTISVSLKSSSFSVTERTNKVYGIFPRKSF